MIINDVKASEIMNSRKEKTILVSIETKDGKFEASAPGGKSRGKNEAEPISKKGIEFSISCINTLGKKIIQDGTEFRNFKDLEKIEELIRKIDNTEDFSIFGGNAVYAFEAAVLKAMAGDEKKPLWKFLNNDPKIIPKPLGNCIGGGKHISQEKKTDFQEFLILPQTKHFFDAYFINLQAYKEAKKDVMNRDTVWKGSLTDENAIAVSIDDESAMDLLLDVSKSIKEEFKINIELGIDIAAASLWNGVNYSYKNPARQKKLSKEEQIEYIFKLIEKYNLVYVEDPLEEEDFEGFARLLRIISSKNPKCLIVGDDLICTKYDRLKKAIQKKSINAVIIKPNQNGSLIQTKKVIDLAHENGIKTIMSHRSGETMDNTIAHLAIGWQTPIIKTGILGRERFAKLNELLKIERFLLKK